MHTCTWRARWLPLHSFLAARFPLTCHHFKQALASHPAGSASHGTLKSCPGSRWVEGRRMNVWVGEPVRTVVGLERRTTVENEGMKK